MVPWRRWSLGPIASKWLVPPGLITSGSMIITYTTTDPWAVPFSIWSSWHNSSFRWECNADNAVQILPVGGNHWVCVSTIGCPPSTIDVYDSLYSHLPANSQEQLATILQTTESTWISGSIECKGKWGGQIVDYSQFHMHMNWQVAATQLSQRGTKQTWGSTWKFVLKKMKWHHFH